MFLSMVHTFSSILPADAVLVLLRIRKEFFEELPQMNVLASSGRAQRSSRRTVLICCSWNNRKHKVVIKFNDIPNVSHRAP